MKKLKIFLAAISMMTASTCCACGGDYEDIYNDDIFVFLMPMSEQIKKNNLALKNSAEETLNFWSQYTNDAIGRTKLQTAINELQLKTFTNNELYKNALTKYLSGKRDNIALKFLRYNCQLNEGYVAYNDWEYHDPLTTANVRSLLNKVSQLPINGRLADRILFMKLRCLFRLNNYKECINLWNTRLKNVKNTALRNRMEGYIGGAYFWTKRYNEAIDIFQKYGDTQSINSAVNKMLKSSTKEQIYAHNPNSLALEYAMQSYANYFYHCNASRRQARQNPELYTFTMDEGGIWQSVTRDYDNTIAFAERVVNEGKTERPMFWAGFIGFMKFVNGDTDEAYEWLCKAQNMNGTEEMAFGVRLWKFAASINMRNRPSNFDDYFLTEYKFFMQNAKEISQKYQNYWQSSNGDELVIPAYKEAACSAFSFDITREAIRYYNKGIAPLLFQAIDDRYGRYFDDGMGAKYIQTLNEKNSIDQDKYILEQYKSGGKNKIDKALIALADNKVISNDLLCDIIGTKLFRQLRFSEAKDYFSQVSINYYNNLAIAPYLAKRRMPSTLFQRKNYENYWDVNVNMTSNVKFMFTNKLASIQNRIFNSTGDAKAQAEIELANNLFQSSPAGDLWALTSYSWSCYEQESELTQKIVNLLQNALSDAETIDKKKKIWFGLAAVYTNDNYVDWTYGDNYNHYHWDFSKMNSWQRDAYRHLASCVSRNDDLYRSCDILRSYIRKYN